MGLSNTSENVMFKGIPGTIRELLRRLVERRITIVLDAEEQPEKVEVEAVVGNLLVAETDDHKFKFVDIKCICAVIVSREELLESIFSTKCHENEDHKHEAENPEKVHKHEHEHEHEAVNPVKGHR